MEPSSIPDTLDNLVALAQARTGAGQDLEGVFVQDGPLPTLPSAKRILIIGGEDTGQDPAVEGEQSWVTQPGRERDEKYSVLCTALAWDGGTKNQPLRRQAFDIMAAVERMLRTGTGDPKIGGAVKFAAVTGPIVVSPMQTDKGAVARVYFQIECTARLS